MHEEVNPREQHIGLMSNYKRDPMGDKLTEGKRMAIVMTHFGTTHSDTRAKTIDVINTKAQALHEGITLRDAYTSRIILKRLRDRGEAKLNLPETLRQLHSEGYTHIVVQPTVLIDGLEMESIRKDVQAARGDFEEIRVGAPLFYHPIDYYRTIEALTADYDKDTAYVWVGHGTYHPSTAQYTMITYILRELGLNNVFVGTIEGFPTQQQAMAEVEASGYKKVRLIPFMFVAGEHAKNDIAEDWREDFEQAGYEVSVSLQGLGEHPGVQQLYLQKLDDTITYSEWDIMSKKKIYTLTGEKMD
ncbi:sirohydrochlorin cobaltochelatase [Porphyromonas sp.]|uniref:sirohydrochlorin cobaltochelatase n=1 Tax=Porphyromonas sp. TaxID=1924944 RepID=UPI0026DD6B49|nr:sirohydrochlorin cobaltochelatase [Porphyromonas sp.]MDO4771344.1 sirohydrochlorin cobaltochelatase [Porphyromonas sp.]